MSLKLKPHPEYKDSGLPWLSRIPSHWEVRRNGRLFSQRNQTGFSELPILEVSLKTGVRVRDFENSKRKQVMADPEKYKRAAKGDIAYNMMRMWQGAVGVAPVDGLVSPAYMVARPYSETETRYYSYLFRAEAYMAEVDKYSHGIVKDRNRLYWDEFKQMPSPFPPTEEQKTIVDFLEAHGRMLRRLVRAKRRLIELLNEQKQVIIHQAVTRGLDPNVRLKPSGFEWLGNIPEHWEVRRAKDLCSRIVDCKNRTPLVVETGDYIVVRTSNVRKGKLDLSLPTPTDEANYKEWTRRGAPQEGDIFFTREAPVGEACLVPANDNLCMGQRMMYFRPDPTLMLPGFLLASIYGPLIRGYVQVTCNGSTVDHMRLGQVYAMPLLWCPLSEQTKIVSHIDGQSQRLDSAVANAECEIDLLLEYRTRLISDVVTGKLDVRDLELPALDEAEPIEDLDALDETDVEDGGTSEEEADE